MARKGFLKELEDGGYLVGASDKESGYDGPVAQVSATDTWLYIITDDYEGVAMLNIEALPHLRRALSKIAKARANHSGGVE